MKIKFAALILDAKGKPIPVAGTPIDEIIKNLGADAVISLADVRAKLLGPSATMTTLRDIAIPRLEYAFAGKAETKPADVMKAYRLMNKITGWNATLNVVTNPDEVDLTAEEIVFLKERICDGQVVAFAVGRAYDIIDPPEETKPEAAIAEAPAAAAPQAKAIA